MYDITMNSMIYAHKYKEQYSYTNELYCRAHKAITQEQYNVCKDCNWKRYCHGAVEKLR